MMNERDQSLVNAYLSVGQSVDRIAAFTDLRWAFLDRVPAEVRAAGDDQIIWRLIQLRKASKLPPSEN